MAEFDWWLLIVGLVLGAGLTWLVVSDARRRDVDLDERERASEVAWIVARLTPSHRRIDAAVVGDVLEEHRGYLAAPPPDPEWRHRRAIPAEGVSETIAAPAAIDELPMTPAVDAGSASEPAAEDGLGT